ncbi:(Lyso)-N-acylphosphatidylethanolamine lipase-like isoform X1 [Physella acuta]|uniref:(Lyso)-N-acylphosphatidylethanolamine lipase-like isoform X1 n=1 Tax=Physella acuta TaxID=109671 RepID=UPI0027DD7529|nr:(Lyso)-N-acylphosphatidylethanolamine lipase-like isoform X1 [Physella acuta]
MSFMQLFIILPIRVFTSILKSLFHSWLKLRWTPSSKSWLMRLDRKIRNKLTHKNHAEWVSVAVGKKVYEIWTVFVEGDIRDSIPLVIIHGMGGGTNMFLNNIDDLAEERDVILLDLPGFGLSSRPELRIKYENGWWVDTTVDDIEEFYTEVLESWFQKMSFNNFILLGHSYGGYLSSVYCLKYPSRVKHLILADPWGFPQRPAAAEMRPFMRSRSIVLLSKLYGKMNIFTPLRILGPLALPLFRAFKLGIKAMFVVKMSGNSDDSADLIVRQRILRQEDFRLFPDSTMQDYCFLWMLRSMSGEVGFSRVSIPFGWARKPLVERVHAWDPKLDVTFIYGARSWVDSQPGYETKNHRHDNYVDVQVISGAGHHVYADRPKAFNHIVQMIGEAVDEGRSPNISHEFEQRHLAMSSLRRRSSCASQGEFLNDEAGIRQVRALSSHELTELYNKDDKDGSKDETDESHPPHVKFNLNFVTGEEHEAEPKQTSEFPKRMGRRSSLQGTIKNVKFSTDNISSILEKESPGENSDDEEDKSSMLVKH